MANWKKLNKEFDNVLSKLTDEQWDKWYKKIKLYNDVRIARMEIREGKTISMEEFFGEQE